MQIQYIFHRNPPHWQQLDGQPTLVAMWFHLAMSCPIQQSNDPTENQNKIINLKSNFFGCIQKCIWFVFTFEQVTIIPLLKRKCSTASQWWINVLTISPERTSQTRTVESLEPLIITLSSYCKHSTEPVCPVNVLIHFRSLRSQILIVLSRNPDTILFSSYCKQ